MFPHRRTAAPRSNRLRSSRLSTAVLVCLALGLAALVVTIPLLSTLRMGPLRMDLLRLLALIVTFALLILFWSLTERKLWKRQQAAIQTSEQRYRSLVDNNEDIVLFVDTKGLIQSANPSVETILGYAPEALLQTPYWMLIDPAHHADSHHRYLRVMQGESQNVFLTLLHRNGSKVEVHEKKIPAIVNDVVTGFFVIVRDRTAQRAAEELLIKSERLSAAGDLAAGIAHEIRNPLTALKGFVQLMQSSRSEYDQYLTIMTDELNRIDTIVSELLVFAKPAEPHLVRHDLRRVVPEVVELLSPQSVLGGVTLQTTLPDDAADVICDPNRIKQVMVNVIKNAMEAMAEDGGQISITMQSAAGANRSTVTLTICDDGPGIPEAVLAHVGEPFYTTKAAGTGLGLMVSRKIIEAHNGVLHVTSRVGEGTQVEIVLPLA
ncbi:PAS domain S-box protein [Alicyclobacillus cycloheptanicus]|uniref:histidine kinase n=1 Tax=Alicyclobacillus cycloheptanicus TaxID=1457 RepID=A0ABT9XN85_9BACL|nr:ATP-binding protein [Alicyclobacillus cycloheptanicus]MDQ0191193.1 PAS domain S-box-containing protein [Alicyclobacillus cycloheptanicus]WDM02108.1 PAS domain S-box protein [Alicyclobacillus cycloheptanicus]